MTQQATYRPSIHDFIAELRWGRDMQTGAETEELVLVPRNHRANLWAIERVHYDGTATMHEEDDGRCILNADLSLIEDVQRAGFGVFRDDLNG